MSHSHKQFSILEITKMNSYDYNMVWKSLCDCVTV